MFCFVLSSTSEFTMVAPLKFLSVYSCRVLWRRALILVLGFALVFSQDSESVSVELSPPAVNKKTYSTFSPLPALVRTAPLMISLSLAPVDTYFKQCAPPTLAFIKVWQPCQYPVKKAILCLNGRNKCGHKSKYGWGVVRIVCKAICSDVGTMHGICASHLWPGMSYAIKLLTRVWHFHQYA